MATSISMISPPPQPPPWIGLPHVEQEAMATHQINSIENRSVLHVALRALRDAVKQSDGKNVVPDVWNALDKFKDLSERFRNGRIMNL